MVYRLFCLGSHYRKSLVFSYTRSTMPAQAYTKLVARIAALDGSDGAIDEEELMRLKASFRDALDNDLNTSLAITALYDVLKSPANDATKLAAVAVSTACSRSGLSKLLTKRETKAPATTQR